MRNLRKVTLLCACALAVVALTAPTASAQENPIEVVEAGTEDHCDPCSFHVVGGHTLKINGFPISICADELEGEIYESHELGLQGHIHTYENDQPIVAPCNVINCNGVGENFGESEWPIGPIGETGPAVGHMAINLCLDSEINPNGRGFHCNAEVNFQSAFKHRYRFTANHLCPNNVRIEGQWELEAIKHHDIELVHP
jgi:hypothetical protein